MAAPAGFGRALRSGALAGLIIALLCAVALGAFVLTGHRLPGQVGAEADRALVIAALPDENGDLVAQVIADVDVSGAETVVRSVDPSSPVSVPGTSYHLLRDTYAFGGGAGLADAYARLESGQPLPFIDFGSAALSAAITAGGGIELDLPAAMDVFDGTSLYRFQQGRVSATATEFRAILNGAAYLPGAQRESILSQSASELVRILPSYPGGIEAAVEAGQVGSSMGARGAATFVTRLTQER